MIADMLLAFGAGPFMFSEVFVVPCFVLMYILTPRIASHIKLD